MLEIADARRIVLDNVLLPEPVERPLGPELIGLTLAESAVSDMDMPSFDKAMMDGFALRAADVAESATLRIVGEVFAGHVPTKAVHLGEAMRIATGAGIPEGADAVVMVERTDVVEDRVQIFEAPKKGQNIQPRALEMRRGEIVVPAGAWLRPEDIGLLAMTGHAAVRVHPQPTVAVLSTGDEIVSVDQTPGPGQIRNSNGVMLLAQIQRAGGRPIALGIARDDRQALRDKIEQGLAGADILVLSGGVSAGRADFVPSVLAELGVTALFHKVRVKPGKPLLFGRRDGTLVFGLPGNPVSSLVCFELFVRPAIERMSNRLPCPRYVDAFLGEDVKYRTDRPTYHPARLTIDAGKFVVRPVPWLGSPDLRGVAGGNAFLVHESGEHARSAGDLVTVLVVDDVI
jgi:molybdopterin molybdotransferase